ncbi:MAG: DUF262 domain-containing protein [Candidatus Saccharicenans sp.]|nr:DUF262 domain-containing protein [Candidatus Saccharicenans sp.]
MKITSDNEKLLSLIEWARKGKLVIPQFQRNFVWGREDITELMISILQGHFIGSFLFLEVDKEDIPFSSRLLEGINPQAIGNNKPELMILDGQQRLTSLHYIFAGPDIPLRWTKHPYRFFLNLTKAVEGDLENAIYSLRSQDCDALNNLEYQFEQKLIPFTRIEKWDDWQNDYEKWLVERDKEYYLNIYFKAERPAWKKIVDQIRDFQIPILKLPKISSQDNQNQLAEICTIFEKLNTMGVKLSVYDLLTARLYKDQIDMHSLWLKTVQQYNFVDQFSEGKPDEFGVYILRALALIRGLDVKSKTLINLSPKNFAADWDKASKYINKSLDRITKRDGFGAFDRKWVPYVTMVSPMAAMLAAIDDQNMDHRAYELIKKWYWSSVFTERYAGAVESIIHKDLSDFIRAYKESDYEPEATKDAHQDIIENEAFSLKSTARLNSVYRGVICLIALNGAKDFCADDSIQFHNLEDHHIFPVEFLRSRKDKFGNQYDPSRINCIINRTLIAEKTNKKIGKRNPSDYIENLIPKDRRDEILKSHLISPEAIEAMLSDNFDAFIDAREKHLIARIREKIS